MFSGELQVLGKKSSVTSVILENIHLYRLTPVGAFFLLLVEVCPAQGYVPEGDGPVPLGFALEGPSLFCRGLLSGDSVPSCD